MRQDAPDRPEAVTCCVLFHRPPQQGGGRAAVLPLGAPGAGGGVSAHEAIRPQPVVESLRQGGDGGGVRGVQGCSFRSARRAGCGEGYGCSGSPRRTGGKRADRRTGPGMRPVGVTVPVRPVRRKARGSCPHLATGTSADGCRAARLPCDRSAGAAWRRSPCRSERRSAPRSAAWSPEGAASDSPSKAEPLLGKRLPDARDR